MIMYVCIKFLFFLSQSIHEYPAADRVGGRVLRHGADPVVHDAGRADRRADDHGLVYGLHRLHRQPQDDHRLQEERRSIHAGR